MEMIGEGIIATQDQEAVGNDEGGENHGPDCVTNIATPAKITSGAGTVLASSPSPCVMDQYYD